MNLARPPHGAWPVCRVWLVLVVISIAGFILGEGAAPARIATCIAIGLAALKIQLIFFHYMDVSRVHRELWAVLSLWLGAVTIMLLAGFLAA